jgi:hypothetical protein
VHRPQIGRRERAVRDRGRIADGHADQRAEKAGHAPAPHAQAHHGAEGDRGDDEVRQVLGLRHADAEQAAEREATERHRDQHDTSRRSPAAVRPQRARSRDSPASIRPRTRASRMRGDAPVLTASSAGPGTPPCPGGTGTRRRAPRGGLCSTAPRQDQHRRRERQRSGRGTARFPAEMSGYRGDRDNSDVLQAAPARHGRGGRSRPRTRYAGLFQPAAILRRPPTYGYLLKQYTRARNTREAGASRDAETTGQLRGASSGSQRKQRRHRHDRRRQGAA